MNIAAAVARPRRAEKLYSNVQRYGNTSAASIPMALAEAAASGRLRPGDLTGLVGFGGGLSWGAMVIEWSAAPTKTAVSLNWGRREGQYVRAGLRRAWLRRWRQWSANAPRAAIRRYRRRLVERSKRSGGESTLPERAVGQA